MPRRLVVLLVVTAAVLASPDAVAQPPAEFRARLSTVPIDVTMLNKVAGQGSVTARLSGTTLIVAGTFAGLKSPATVARIHVGPKGIRGPAAHDLTVSPAPAGTIAGRLELTAEQVDDLRNSRLYVQLHSEQAPDGNLWGWLLPREARR